MKGPIMHSPASNSSAPWRLLAIFVLVSSIALSPWFPARAEARSKAKSKTSHAQDGKTNSKPSKKKGKRSKKHHGRQAAHRCDPTKLVMPPTEPSPVLNVASHFLGSPYRFGATSGSFDCSGFVRRVFEELGVDLPHSAREQFSLGDLVHRQQLEPGDLVFFRTYRRDASHVGIYVGEDKFIHAATRGGQVQVDSLNEAYYSARYLGARRIDMQS